MSRNPQTVAALKAAANLESVIQTMRHVFLTIHVVMAFHTNFFRISTATFLCRIFMSRDFMSRIFSAQ